MDTTWSWLKPAKSTYVQSFNVHINLKVTIAWMCLFYFTVLLVTINIYSEEESEGIVIPSLLMVLNIHTVMITLLLSLLAWLHADALPILDGASHVDGLKDAWENVLEHHLLAHKPSKQVFIGAGLPILPKRLVDKMHNGEYINFNEMLPVCDPVQKRISRNRSGQTTSSFRASDWWNGA